MNKNLNIPTNHTLLSTHALSKVYHMQRATQKNVADDTEDLQILKKIDLDIKAKQLHAITGASGSGKSTLLQILAGLDGYQGEIKFLGQSLNQLNTTQQAILRNQFMGFIYQMHHLIPELTALENVMVPYWIAQRQEKNIEKFFDFLIQSFQNPQKEASVKEAAETQNFFLNIIAEKKHKLNSQKHIPIVEKATARAQNLLERLGLSKRMEHKPSQLSGGERQRVAIARAFMNSPFCIFADEPTGNLDQFHAGEVFDLFKSMVKEENTSLVLVTHDLNLAQKCDVHYELRQGVLYS